jgi:regulator of sigma E protease
MSAIITALYVILLIVVVLAIFNIIIFVHELGHFLAAKWRGLRIERFQIWFGKPIWKKNINGVQYGLGWIPAGGFVALPQMAPMDAIEGGNTSGSPLPPISATDKIIVAFAGPLFSMLLALLSGVVVWGVGKPKDVIPTQIVGEVAPDGPAAKAGILSGDKITHINGIPVVGWAGTLNSITESIILSEGEQIEFVVERPGLPEPIKLVSEFDTPETKWFQRSGLRRVGIGPKFDNVGISRVYKGGPAHRAGFEEGDLIVSVDGRKFGSDEELVDYIKAEGRKLYEFSLLRDDKPLTIRVTPEVPESPPGKGPMLGVGFYNAPYTNQTIVHPGPIEQVGDSVRMMWTTITKLVSPQSSIGVDQLSGPVGIFKLQLRLLQTDEGWRRILAFMVIFNVNLAILNMMPFPVLDGGHITLALMEKIFRRPVRTRPLEIIQTACALALISLMLYITSKDIGDDLGQGGEKIIFKSN